MLYWIGLVFCLMSGAAAYAVYDRWQQKKARRLPRHLPLETRYLVNQDELGVWQWLQNAFHDHHVLIKVSVIRFTTPRITGQSERWHGMLNGVYPTFSICDEYGDVVGCVDVSGSRSQNQGQRDLKQTLFHDCGIPYAVVRAGSLPTSQAIRAAFLAESDQHPLAEEATQDSHQNTVPDRIHPEPAPAPTPTPTPTPTSAPAPEPEPKAALKEIREADFTAARRSLRAKLEHNRRSRFVNFDPLSKAKSGAPASGPEKDTDGELAAEWQNSFIMPFEDSMPSQLQK